MRSVATNIRDYYGGGGTQRHGNSIFIFEVANLCIAHLGHLHHTLNQQQLNEIGRVDVVLVPVDGGATLDLEGMIEVLTALKAPLMIPMHFFSTYTLDRFLQRISRDWDVERADVPSVVVSKHTLPDQAETAGAARPLRVLKRARFSDIGHANDSPQHDPGERDRDACGGMRRGPAGADVPRLAGALVLVAPPAAGARRGRLPRGRARHARLRPDAARRTTSPPTPSCTMSATWSRWSRRSARSAP